MLALCVTLVLTVSLQSENALPQLAAREFAPHGNTVTHLASNAGGTRLFTADVSAPSAEGSNQTCAPVRGWDVKKESKLWEVSALTPGIVGFGVGDERLARSDGQVAFSTHDVEIGERSGGIGGPNIMSKSSCLVLDPQDRWIWKGTDEGGVTALTIDAKGRKLVGTSGGSSLLAWDISKL